MPHNIKFDALCIWSTFYTPQTLPEKEEDLLLHAKTKLIEKVVVEEHNWLKKIKLPIQRGEGNALRWIKLTSIAGDLYYGYFLVLNITHLAYETAEITIVKDALLESIFRWQANFDVYWERKTPKLNTIYGYDNYADIETTSHYSRKNINISSDFNANQYVTTLITSIDLDALKYKTNFLSSTTYYNGAVNSQTNQNTEALDMTQYNPFPTNTITAYNNNGTSIQVDSGMYYYNYNTNVKKQLMKAISFMPNIQYKIVLVPTSLITGSINGNPISTRIPLTTLNTQVHAGNMECVNEWAKWRNCYLSIDDVQIKLDSINAKEALFYLFLDLNPDRPNIKFIMKPMLGNMVNGVITNNEIILLEKDLPVVNSNLISNNVGYAQMQYDNALMSNFLNQDKAISSLNNSIRNNKISMITGAGMVLAGAAMENPIAMAKGANSVVTGFSNMVTYEENKNQIQANFEIQNNVALLDYLSNTSKKPDVIISPYTGNYLPYFKIEIRIPANIIETGKKFSQDDFVELFGYKYETFEYDIGRIKPPDYYENYAYFQGEIINLTGSPNVEFNSLDVEFANKRLKNGIRIKKG